MNPSDTAWSHLDSWWFAVLTEEQETAMQILEWLSVELKWVEVSREKRRGDYSVMYKNDFGGVSLAVVQRHIVEGAKKSTLWQWSMLQHTKLATICIKLAGHHLLLHKYHFQKKRGGDLKAFSSSLAG